MNKKIQQDISEILNERNINSFERLFEALGLIIEKNLMAEEVYFFIKEDLLPELQISWGSESTKIWQKDQFFTHLKSFVYQCMDGDPQIMRDVSIPLLNLHLKSMVVYPIYFGEGQQGVWLIANPTSKNRFFEQGDLDLLDGILSTCFPILEQLKLKQIVQIYQTEQRLSAKLNHLIESNRDFNTFLKSIREIIEDTIQCQIILFLMFNHTTGQYYLEAGNAEGCEFWAIQEDLFKNLARQAETQGVFARTYSGRNFQGEKYGLDRLETSLVMPLKFYERNSGAFILLNKRQQKNFNEIDVRLMHIIIRNIKPVIFRERERNTIVSLFEKFVSDKIVREILENQESGILHEERREISILFIDLNGFTSISESEQPSVVIEQLNQFLTEMTEQVFLYGGTLDKYIGDEIMAIFGSPISLENHAERAVECALAMKQGMESLSASWKLQKKSELTASIGIATGVAVVGTIGCEKYMDYTAIGDTVNTASRITKAASRDTILLEASTADRLEPVAILQGPMELQLKGKQKIVTVCILERLKTEQELESDLQIADTKGRIEILKCLGSLTCYRKTQLARRYISDADLRVRKQALDTISRLDRQEDIDCLMEQFDVEPDSQFRKDLLEVISNVSSEAVIALLKDYLGELDAETKSLVIGSIGYVDDEENKRLLLPLLNDSNNMVRANVAHAIYRFGDVKVIEILLKMLESQETEMQISAIDVLAKIGTTQVVQPLVQVVISSSISEKVKYAAARALGKLTKPRSIKYFRLLTLENEQLVEWKFLARALASESDDQHQLFSEALMSPNRSVAYSALVAIQRLNLHGYSREIVELVSMDCEYIKEQSILALRSYANGIVIPVYLSCLDNCSEAVTVIILTELGQRNQGQLQSIILRYLDSECPEIQMAAISSLAQIKKPDTVDRLLRVFEQSNNANVNATLIRALAEFPSKKIVGVLHQALRSTIGRIRANAIDVLVEVEGEQVLPLIEPLLEDENNRVRANAALALHRFGRASAFEHLDTMMGSDDKWMRLSAIWTLAEIGSEDSRKIIAKHLNDSDYDVKLRAILSLNRLDSKLLQLLGDILDSREELVDTLIQQNLNKTKPTRKRRDSATSAKDVEKS